MSQMDWSQLQKLADAEKFEPLPEETYHFVVEGAEMKPAQTGTGMNIKLKAKVISGPEAGRKTFGQIFVPYPNADVKPGTYGMMQAKLNGLGVTLAALAAAGAEPAQVGLMFVGKEFMGAVKHRQWQGRTIDGIENYAPVGGVPQLGTTKTLGGGTEQPAHQAPPKATF